MSLAIFVFRLCWTTEEQRLETAALGNYIFTVRHSQLGLNEGENCLQIFTLPIFTTLYRFF